MTDDNLDTYSSPEEEPERKPTTGQAVRKLGFTLAVLAVAWVIFTQVAPRLTLPESTLPSTKAIAKRPQKAPEPPVQPFDSSALEARIHALESEITRLKTQSGKQPDTTKQMAAMRARIEELAAESNKKLEEQIRGQQRTIKQLQRTIGQIRNETGTHLAGITAFSQLRETVLRGEPFEYELKRLKRMTRMRRDIQKILTPLSALAANGIVTNDALNKTFEQAVPLALSPNTKPDSMLANVSALIRIRKTGTPAGTDDESIIARAEAALNDGRVQGTLLTLKELSPAAASAFTDWITKAQQYILSREALDSLELALLNKRAHKTTRKSSKPTAGKTSQDKKPVPLPPHPFSHRVKPTTPAEAPNKPADSTDTKKPNKQDSGLVQND